MSDYANYHAGFGGLFRGKRLTGILSELMGEQAVLFKEKVSPPYTIRLTCRSTTKKRADRAGLMLISMLRKSFSGLRCCPADE